MVASGGQRHGKASRRRGGGHKSRIVRHFQLREDEVVEIGSESADGMAVSAEEDAPGDASAAPQDAAAGSRNAAGDAVGAGNGDDGGGRSAAKGAPDVSAAPFAESGRPFGAASELLRILSKRRSRTDTFAYESQPASSTADASHLEGVDFNAPVLRDWLRQFHTPEEDRTPELLAEGLEQRGSLPEHAPQLPAEIAGLQHLAEELAEERARLDEEKHMISISHEELDRRERKLAYRERRAAEGDDLRRQREEFEPPPWFDGVVGTINIGVVGNSGVGKSLLINRLRNVQPGEEGWAPVGVKETTARISMYAFPGEPRVRLWDFPGVGTPSFPLATYISKMGLRYLDVVMIVTAGRFTETEVALQQELSLYRVPFCMVRTKADIDVWNNELDNDAPATATIEQITTNLQQHVGVQPYVVSLRYPKEYDFPNLLTDVLPCLRKERTHGADWEESWAIPEVYSPVVSAIQGRWKDRMGTTYYVHGLQVHISAGEKCSSEQGATTLSEDDDGNVWWTGRFSINMASIAQGRRTGELRWAPADVQVSRPMIWWWTG